MSTESNEALEPVLKDIYLCPECGEASFPDEWDAETLKIYVNRKQRRSHVPFLKGLKRRNILYICPSCKQQVKSFLIEKV